MRFFKIFTVLVCFFTINTNAQNVVWQGDDYFIIDSGEIIKYTLPENQKAVFIDKKTLTPTGSDTPLVPKSFSFSADQNKILIYTNSKRVWRQETRGDYWILDLKSKALSQIGKGKPSSSLMFAKISPDGKMAAYVSERNLYIEDLKTHKISPLTQTSGKIINGTFDWAYEEEFDCRDGFRWSPDSKSIAYWQIDANKIKDFLMINNTDEIYAKNVPVEYPKVGESPSVCKVGVANIATKKTTWMNVPGDTQQHYIPRMEWANNSDEVIIQQLNRKQNESKLMYCNAKTGAARTFYQEKDDAWIDVRNSWSYGNIIGWDWVENGQSFIWVSEKDGWRHIYKVAKDGKSEVLLTDGDYDIQKIMAMDTKNDFIYFMASPRNATQSYLYRVNISQQSKAEKVSQGELTGTHGYKISENAKYAFHNFSNYFTPRVSEIIALPSGKPTDASKSILAMQKPQEKDVEFFQVTTVDGTLMDGFIAKPHNFDPKKKYPIVFYVYSEPAGTVVNDVFGVDQNRLYNGDMAEDGYIYAALDGRGTPAPKGREWRKSIYRKIGIVNIRDQAMGALEMFKKYDFIDTSRVAIWGWSGGGSATLNCLFQYPEIYKTGISIAAVANQLTYDNIYQERYMGIPQENREDFVNGSPLHFVKNFRGNLLYIHGTGDDNVHYQNAELLINEMIKYNKQFQFMPYPNRSHGIYEGEGTTLHLSTLYTKYLKEHCAAGGR
ncbi:S9 family peptidase [Lacihabitans sp. LS3-19]|nr:S9 family peptidase [Lacihabitans sp. LS3-19]